MVTQGKPPAAAQQMIVTSIDAELLEAAETERRAAHEGVAAVVEALQARRLGALV